MAVQQNIINDLGVITKVPNRIFSELIDLTNACISSSIAEAKISEQDTISLNIGIGSLGINLITMECKFAPSKDLKHAIKQAISEDGDTLEKRIEQATIDKLLSILDEAI